jgi:hypothetical protein
MTDIRTFESRNGQAMMITEGKHIVITGKPYQGTGDFHILTSPLETFMLEECVGDQFILIGTIDDDVDDVFKWIEGADR